RASRKSRARRSAGQCCAWGCACAPAWAIASITRGDAVDELLHRRHEAAGIEGIILEAIGIMAGEHQLVFGTIRMAYLLQRLLDAEGARIGLLAGGAALILRPIREAAGAEAAHAVDLVGEDFVFLFRGHEDEG